LQGAAGDVFYRVWLSEIMLQQTRVEAVIPYYNLFLQRFPSVERLAAATEEEVLTAWSGLGYYSRARNLHHAAKQIAAAGLPSSYEAIRELRGVGVYTAAAVASIALGQPHAAVDGNVIRVIARLTNDAAEVTSPGMRRRLDEEAARLLDARRPGDFNQAMMELGATVCVPGTPRCEVCPVEKFCAARAAGTARELPVKLKKQVVKEVALDLAIVERAGCIFLVKRSSAERRLAGFLELPALDRLPEMDAVKLGELRHQIVNDRFSITVWHITFGNRESAGMPAGEWLEVSQLERIPLTTVTKKALAARKMRAEFATP
jgi:A/G-specific adenine glycosylase